MRSRFRFGFLPVFFIALAVTLAGAVVLRIRSYDAPNVTTNRGVEPRAETNQSPDPASAHDPSAASTDTAQSTSRVMTGFGAEILNPEPDEFLEPGAETAAPTAAVPEPGDGA